MYTEKNCQACNEPISAEAFQKGFETGAVTINGVTYPHLMVGGVATCPHCGGVQSQGPISENSFARIVNYEYETGQYDVEEQRYFDFTVLRMTGKQERYHGWYLPRTKRITQEG